MPGRSHIIGRWSEIAGYEADLSRDNVPDFRADGSFQIATDGEHIESRWECEQPGKLVFIISRGHRYGPFTVLVELRHFPLGDFEVLGSDGALLPAAHNPGIDHRANVAACKRNGYNGG